MNPKPPETLNKETRGVWNGWNNMGDEKVAHEAAMKGLHISLAIEFLSLRQQIGLDEAKIWFEEEVRKWVLELLDRRQIGRASHIFSNIGLDSDKELSQIFYKTEKTPLRDYIGQHLIKHNKLDEELKSMWDFFNLIGENSIDIDSQKISSIESLSVQNERQKAEIAVRVFLKTDNVNLVKYLNSEVLWEHLVLNLDANSLISWIHVRYSSYYVESEPRHFIDYFKKHHISTDMISFLSQQNESLFKNVILNNLAKFGVFTNNEKLSIVAVLNRLKITKNITNIIEIFSKSSASLSLENFNQLLLHFCLEEKLFAILGDFVQYFKLTIPHSNELDLLQEMYVLINDFSVWNLAKNILKFGDVEYLSRNLIDLISVIICRNDSVSEAPYSMEGINIDTALTALFKNYKILNSVLAAKTADCEISINQLIETHQPYSIAQLLPAHSSCPNFQNSESLKNYAYCKQLNYKFYLMQGRPCIAAKYHFLKNLKNLDENKIFKLAFLHFDDLAVTSACIAFLEIINFNSSKIRILVEIAKILQKFGFERNVVLKLLHSDEPDSILHRLEAILIERIDENHIIEAFKMFELLVCYSKINNLKYPEAFLKFCASRNLWLLFLIFAQLHGYPLDQVKFHIQFFKSATLMDHLSHGICNEMPEERHSRDSRKYLLSKVGVVAKIVPRQSSALSFKSHSSYESEESSTGSDHFEIDVSNIKATLLQTLIRCHTSTDPPKAFLQACQFYRNPLLAVFATSYEPDSIIANWLTWLGVSCELYQIFTNYEAIAFSANAVSDLLENCIINHFSSTLLQSFIIFIPDNPLKIFIQLLVEDFSLSIKNQRVGSQLKLFFGALKKLRHNSIISETDHEMTYLNNRQWIEVTALRLLAAFLDHQCQSIYDQILIIEALSDLKVWENFLCDVPDFSTILAILEVLNQSRSDVRLDITRMCQTGTKREATIECITNLLEKHSYQAALQISKIKKLPPDLILIKECQHQMLTKNDQKFWHSCNQTFESYNVTADCVIDFYVECANVVESLHEKCVLLKLAYEWASKYNLSSQFELERKMWLGFLDVDDQQRESSFVKISPSKVLYSDFSKILLATAENDVDSEATAKVEKFLEFVLNRGNFELALKLQKMFHCENSDLEVLKLCCNLAEEILQPHQLNQKERRLLLNYNARKSGTTYVVRKISSICSGSYNPSNLSSSSPLDVVESSANDTLAILKLLVENLQNGVEIGQNIFMTYRISLNIGIPYKIVTLIVDHKKMLTDALDSDCLNKLDVVHDIAVVYKWTKPELVDFICEELITAMIDCIKSNQEMRMWDLDLDKDFQLIFQLLQEASSTLGRKMFTYLSALHKCQIESRLYKKDILLIVELLIRAHDCFTADCNMEGISLILEKSKEIISNLLNLQEWRLIVRLLTQVARYTEMSYVFELLLENDQFECLLNKNLKKDNVLKMALLTFFKKHWPENNEIYKIIALHFALFPEVAQLWEKESQNIIKNQISIAKLEMQNNKLNIDDEIFVLFYSNQSIINCLNRVMENYTHATEFYLRGEKMSKALHSAKQAELIALQISFLREVPTNETTPCILFLTTFQLSKIISRKFSFSQLRILLEAYNFSPDWSNVLYEQYILNDQDTFFEEFLEHFPLTDTLVQDIYRKIFASNNNFSARSMTCMKNILHHVPSVLFKYRIASELGFTDLIGDLISSGQLMYLKDTVWKRGFKNS